MAARSESRTLRHTRVAQVVDRWLAPIGFAAVVAICVAMWIFKPVAHGHSYHLGVRVAVVMAVVWLLYRWLWPLVIAHFRVTLALGLAFGLYLIVHRFVSIDPNAEIVSVYQSLFDALGRGDNPYACMCIYHRAEFGVVKYANFNYPPLEIWPYYFEYKVVGFWDSRVLVFALVALQTGVCAVALSTHRHIKRSLWVPFLPIFVLYELFTNVATSFLFVAGIIYVISNEARFSASLSRPLLCVLFGAGLLTKFIIAPLCAAYYWWQLDVRSWRSWLVVSSEVLAVAAVAILFMVPFGVMNTLESTVLFNLVLEERGSVTTFYPNVLSGALSWAGASQFFPAAAVVVLGASILYSRYLELFSALLLAAIVFMFVSPTPEPQFIPIVVYIAVAGALKAYQVQRLGTSAK